MCRKEIMGIRYASIINTLFIIYHSRKAHSKKNKNMDPDSYPAVSSNRIYIISDNTIINDKSSISGLWN